MSNTEQDVSKQFAAGMWKLIMARAIFLIIVGLILLLFPKGTLATLIFIMGIYWLIDGITTIINALQRKKIYANWWWGLISGGLAVFAACIVLAKPLYSAEITTSFLMWFFGIVAVISGTSGLLTGIKLNKTNQGERSMIWGGIFSIIFGIVLMSSPFTSALVIIKTIGSLAIFAGIITALVANRVKKKAEEITLS